MRTLPILMLLIALAYLAGSEIQTRRNLATAERIIRKPYIWLLLVLATLALYLATKWTLR